MWKGDFLIFLNLSKMQGKAEQLTFADQLFHLSPPTLIVPFYSVLFAIMIRHSATHCLAAGQTSSRLLLSIHKTKNGELKGDQSNHQINRFTSFMKMFQIDSERPSAAEGNGANVSAQNGHARCLRDDGQLLWWRT